jgi:hypothetical protein
MVPRNARFKLGARVDPDLSLREYVWSGSGQQGVTVLRRGNLLNGVGDTTAAAKNTFLELRFINSVYIATHLYKKRNLQSLCRLCRQLSV